MENATNAIKTVFGVIVFCIAIGICFMMFGKLKTTFDIVSNSKSNLYFENEEVFGEDLLKNQKRIVGKETVISNILNYVDSRYIIYLQKGNYNEETGNLNVISKIEIYESNTGESLNYFDVFEEVKRRESFATSKENVLNHLNIILYGGDYEGKIYNGILNNELKGNIKFLEEISKSTDSDGNEKISIYYTII